MPKLSVNNPSHQPSFVLFDHLLTKEPHEIRAVFVSDVHLCEHQYALTEAFLVFLDDLIALPHLKSLFVLGDLVDTWVGDDAYFATPKHYLTPIITKLAVLSQKTNIFIMHGNKDFLIGKRLCASFGGVLVGEPYCLKTHVGQIRLEHGDRLCLDDKGYQYYRRFIQNPLTKRILLALPILVRQKLANNIKQKSSTQKSQKSSAQMNTTAHALAQALKNCTLLIHGHTHKPAFNGQIMVLGDWQITDNQVSAYVGVLSDELVLCQFLATTQRNALNKEAEHCWLG